MADLVITDQNFDEEVLKSQLPVLVDFWAPWCTPCKIVGPIVKELAVEYAGKLKVGEMNVDENPQVPGNFGVMSIPSLIIFKNGKPVATTIGAQGKDVLKKMIDEALSA
ncbi:MAG: thioredoxin [bacterium]|nr:thioredoxin [bacterium]